MPESKNLLPMNDDPFNGELLSAYLDGELTDEERNQVETRLRDDEGARDLLDQLRSASEALRNLPQHTLGFDLREKVLDGAQVQPRSTILDYNSDDYEANDHGSGRRIVYAAAAIAAALLLMFYQGGENAGDDQLAMSGDKVQVGTPDAVIRSGNPENTQIAGMGGLSAMFSSRQTKNEVAEPEMSTIPSPNVELIGDQLLGDAPLEHLHVHLKPKAGGAGDDAFAELLKDCGVTLVNSAPTTSAGYAAQMILVDAPLPQIRKLLLRSQLENVVWESVTIKRQSDSAPALSFFAVEEGPTESLMNLLSIRGSAGNSWALYLGRGTEAVALSDPRSTLESDSSDPELASNRVVEGAEAALDAARGNLRVLFILLPAGE